MTLLPFGQPLGGMMQVAFVVEDIHKSMKEWTDSQNVGPFFLLEHFELLDLRYRGKPADFDITLALAYTGSMCVELIQMNDAKPSLYREMVEARGYGFHHWAVSTTDFEGDLKRFVAMGYPEALYARVSVGARAAYVDANKALGAFIELIEINDKVNGLFASIKAAADNWDGKDPVRRP